MLLFRIYEKTAVHIHDCVYVYMLALIIGISDIFLLLLIIDVHNYFIFHNQTYFFNIILFMAHCIALSRSCTSITAECVCLTENHKLLN